jgi:hypothetical protein
MPLTNYASDKFVARDFSKFTAHGLQPIAPKFDQAPHWLENCILNSIFGSPIADEPKPLLFTIIRRAEHALREYELAREWLDAFITKERSVSAYFLAMSHLETALSCSYQAFDLARKAVNQKLFEKGDGSIFERLNRIYSVIKHLEALSLQPGQLHLLWFTNDGLSASVAVLTFTEIMEIIEDISRLAQKLSKLRYASSEDANNDGAANGS